MTGDPLIGRHLGAFQILELIGQGGMAAVYKAMQPAMNRVVAVKVLSPQMAGNPAFLARFKQEAQMIASLEHAYILPVYDLGEQDGLVYIAMRFMGFGTIQSRLGRGPVPLRDTARWIEQIGAALDYAHQRGIIHRDVKPSNVLLDAQGNAFLADFGIAKWTAVSAQLTGSAVIGTPQYMSPEQGQGLKLDGRSDEYALAVMAYELITGRPPFQADTPLALVLKHVTEPLTPPLLIDPRVPAPVSDVIVKALSKNPDDRYPTTLAFAQALSAAIAASPPPATAQLPAAATLTEAIHATRTQSPARPRALKPILIALAMGLIAVAGIGGAVVLSAVQPTPERPVAVVTLGPNVRLLPTATPRPAAVASTPVPVVASTLEAPADCQPIFTETFDTASGDYPAGEQEGAAWGYGDGDYRIYIKAANYYQTRLIGPTFKDYEVAADLRFASDVTGDYGLVLAARGDDDYLAFVVDGTQRFAVTRRSPNGSTIIQDWTFSSALNAGGAVNRLRAIQRGRDIALYANGVLLRLITDDGDPQRDRRVGFTAASFARGGVDARLDNLRVCEAPSAFSDNRVTLIDTFDDNRNGWAPQRYSAAGTSSIEDGKFQITARYEGQSFGWSDWNPNVAFDQFTLAADLQLTDWVTTSQIGLLFGVQDLSNAYLFSLVADGRYRLYRIADGSYQTIADAQSSTAIRPGDGLNHVQLSMISNTLAISVNNQAVLQAAVAYTPGFIGFWCGVDAPPQTHCTFDNLAVVGTPSTGPLLIYPFCNCRREAVHGQPLTLAWTWTARTPELLAGLQAGSTLTVTLDGQPIADPSQYWGPTQTAGSTVQSRWAYPLPALSPGSHLIEFYVSSATELTDGLDGNGDGRPDTYGPGVFLSGYVETVIQP